MDTPQNMSLDDGVPQNSLKTIASHPFPPERSPLKASLTPATISSSTASSPSNSSLNCSTEISSFQPLTSVRMPLPSPSRHRLDPRYAARLAPEMRSFSSTPRSSVETPRNSDTDFMPPPPPGISRDSNSSIFRPSPIITLNNPEEYSPRYYSAPSSSSDSLMTPQRRQAASDLGVSDRFIPSRATSNFNFNLWEGVSRRSEESQTEASTDAETSQDTTNNDNSNQVGSSTTATAGAQSQQQNLLNTLLRSELLGENENPSPQLAPSGNNQRPSNTAPLREGMNRLRFQSPRQVYQDNVFEDAVGPTAVVNSFSLTPVRSAASQRLMAAPPKRKRRISKVPFKVLDAPALQDDFYLNLVDWSSQNVLAVALGSCVYLWSACTSKVTKLCDLAATEDLVTAVSWAQRGTHLAVGTNRGETQLWDTVKCKKIRSMTGHSARVGTLAWTGPILASGSRDRLIYLRDVRLQAAFTDKLTNHKQEVCGLKWSFDEPAFLASGGNDNHLHVIDSRNPSAPVHKFSEHTAAVKAIAWSPHQHGLLASGGGTADRCIRFWNTLSGTSLNKIDTGSQVCNLAWSQNCNEIVSTHGYSLNQIVVWRYPNMSKVATLTGHTYRVLYLAMSPDGSTVVTGAGDETLRFWQIFPGPRSDGKEGGTGLLFPTTLGSVIR